MDIGRIPPHSKIAEQSVLGSVLIESSVYDEVMAITNANEFYFDRHKEIFEAITEVFDRRDPIDLITVSEQLKIRDTLDKVGGLEYLTEMSNSVPTTANVKHYAGIINEKFLLRSLIKKASEITDMCYEQVKEVDSIISNAESGILNINSKATTKNIFSLGECLAPCLCDLEARVNKKCDMVGLPTGFTDLDYKLAGLQNSDLILIAARPSMGKTAIAINIAEYISINKNIPVAIFSLEMSKEQLVNRILSSQTNIDSHKLKIGRVTDDEWKAIAYMIGPLSESPLYIDDTATINVSEISSKCRKLKKEKGLGIVIIDYLQLMHGKSKSESRQQEISEISRSLKVMAKELDLPVIALSQLSRAPEMRADHRPVLSDLRESGSIEQDADIVMFIYRDDYYYTDSNKKNITEVIISKHRNGGVGTVELGWQNQFAKFVNLERYKR